MSYVLNIPNISISLMQSKINDVGIISDGIVYENNSVMTILGTFTSSEEDLIHSFIPDCKLEYAKEVKRESIFINTKFLISEGFQYASKTFPLLLDNLNNYIGIQVFGGFPYKIQTLDKRDVLTINNQTEYDSFTAAGMSRYTQIKNGESDLIVNIRDATTVSDVDSIIDTRT